MEPDFTKEQAKQMYQILVEIHSALEDKKKNKGGLNKISLMEIGWFIGIEELFKKKMHEPVLTR